jgi:hypothetical protein
MGVVHFTSDPIAADLLGRGGIFSAASDRDDACVERLAGKEKVLKRVAWKKIFDYKDLSPELTHYCTGH